MTRILEEKYSENKILLISAFSFGIIHFVDILTIISAAIIGYYLARTFLETKRLFYSILLHFIINIRSILIFPIIKFLDPVEMLGEKWIFISFLIMSLIFFIIYILTEIVGKNYVTSNEQNL